jgi:hypothetical protein
MTLSDCAVLEEEIMRAMLQSLDFWEDKDYILDYMVIA